MRLMRSLLLSAVILLSMNSNVQAEESLTVGVSAFPPLVFEKDGIYSGFDIELWEAVAERLGLTYSYQQVPFPELFATLGEKKVDVALSGITITEEREKVVDFTHHYMDSGLATLVSPQAGTSILAAIKTILNESTFKLLLSFVVFTIVCGHVLWISERGSSGIEDRYFPGIFEAFWCTLATATTVGYGDVVPKNLFGRLAALFVMLGGIGFFGILSAELMSSMTTLKLGTEIESSADLRGKTVATVKGTTSVDAVRRLGARPVEVEKIENAYALLKEGSVDAVVYDAPVLKYHSRHDGAGEVTLAGEVFDVQYYGIALIAGSKLREEINGALLHFRTDGTYDRIYRKWFGDQE